MLSRRRLWKLTTIALAVVGCLGCSGPFDGPGPDPDPDPDPDGDGDGEPPSSGMGMVAVAGPMECSASLDAETSPPDFAGISDVDGDNALLFNGESEDDSLLFNAVLQSTEPLGDPPVDTTYTYGPEQLRLVPLTVGCTGDTYQLANDEGDTAADLGELTTLQMEVSNWRSTDTVTLSGSQCRRGDSSTTCRVHEGVCDVYFEAVWNTGAGDEVSIVIDAQDIGATWYQNL